MEDLQAHFLGINSQLRLVQSVAAFYLTADFSLGCGGFSANLCISSLFIACSEKWMSKAIGVKRPRQTLGMPYVADMYLPMHGLFKSIFERHYLLRRKTMSCLLSTYCTSTLNQSDKTVHPISIEV